MQQERRCYTILLTGATGFVGSAVLKQIIRDGNLAIVLLRPESNVARLENLKGYHAITYEALLSNDLIDRVKAYAPQITIHLGWRGVGGQERNELYQVTENIPLTLDTVKLAQAVGCRQWIGIGSQAEYGNPNCKVDELYPATPTTVYGKAKLASCWASLGLCQALDMYGSWLRLFSTYGPEDEPHWLIPYLIREMSLGNAPKLTKCEQLWDYLYIDDVAKGVLSIAYARSSGIFNLGSGIGVPLKSIVEIIRELVNPQIKVEYGAVDYRPDQVMHLQADIRKIKEVTGWKPKVNIKEGLRQTVDFYKQDNEVNL